MSGRPPTEADLIADKVFGSYPRPYRYRGLARAAHIGRLIAEDAENPDVPLWLCLRDVINDNKVCFDPPYSDAKLYALAEARAEAEGYTDDE